MSRITTRTITSYALLIAVEIVLSRFLSVQAWNFRIGFSFVPIVIAAYLYGALPAAGIAAIADVIGAILFPTGAYFPGFTLTAALMGATFGICLRRGKRLINTVCAVMINQFIWGLVMNTCWIAILYGSSFQALFATRIAQACLLTVVQVVVIQALQRSVTILQRRIAA